MAKVSIIERNKKRARMTRSQAKKRAELKAQIKNRELPFEERFQCQLKLAELPRNGSKTRLRNRCELTGRGRGYYRQLRMSRIMLRELASHGQIPGMIKSSW